MKINRSLFASVALLALLTIGYHPLTAFAQGSLTPPGAPAPTMKTLAQIEPRTPISAVPFTISAQGSYYLTTNLTTAVSNAIVIAASGVTLDLGGFNLSSSIPSAANGGAAIWINNTVTQFTIKNGQIRGSVANNGSGIYSGAGFNQGIYFLGSQMLDARISDVTVSGCLTYGIFLTVGNSTLVERCSVRTCGVIGILASTIKNSIAQDCGSTAIYGDQVSDCRGVSVNSDGINADVVINCYGSSATSGSGITAETAQNCHGTSGSGYGVSAVTAQNCLGYCDSGFGIQVSTGMNCYGSSSTGTGLYAVTALNCTGQSTGAGSGVSAYNAENCYGTSSSYYGLTANIAHNCYGYSTSGTGLYANYKASDCYGFSSTGTGLYSRNASFCTGYRSGGTAIQATIANGCIAYLGTNIITYKYNMP